jgi:amino acid adenylation domain-containing protein
MDRKQYLAKENVESIWELSLLQQEMFHQLESSENNANHMLRVAFNINGHMELDKIQEAWKQTIRQTPLLRMVFRNARNRTVQVVLKEYPNPIEILDEKDYRANEFAKHFNLKEEVAAHMKLIRKTHDKNIFLLAGHRIILDKKSIISVLEDFLAIYGSLLKNKGLLSLQRPSFKNYLDWLDQQYWLPGISYWERELADFISPTSLLRYQRLGQQKTRPVSAPHLDLTGAQSRGLEQWCQQENFSPDILIQAAWALVLNLYTNDKDIYFGVELPGRPGGIPDFQNIIGPFANILPLKVTIHSQQTLREFIKGVEEKNHRLRRYPYISLQEIHAKLGLPREANLFESSIHVNPYKVDPPGYEDSPLPAHIDMWQDYPHSFALEVFTGKTWRLRLFSFNETLPEAAALQVLKILALLLEGIRKKPGARLSQLNYLSAEAWEKLEDINRTDIQLPGNCLETFMHRVFEEQVEKRPDNIACTQKNHQVSYRELNHRANRLAHWLKQQGINANHLVGILCQRSIEMLTAIIAIFKAGGAYIPLDPANPDPRLKTILVDSGVQVIFTRTPEVERIVRFIKGLPLSNPAPQVFCLESLPGEINIPNAAVLETYSTVNPPLNNHPRDAAYVFFTSGSTGVPKGAVVEHIGMVNHLWTKIRLLQLSHTHKVVQNASHCFDISVWQLLAALMTGGQTIIYSNEVAMNPALLMKSSGINGVTILEMVPAVMEMVLAQDTGSGDPNQIPLPHLKYLLSTGEALPTALCQKWLEKYPHIPVVNAYGPTECSDDTHHRIISPANPLEDYYNDVPLGRIIPNFRGYILDEALSPLPSGGVGEICLTGTGVGKGYLNDPERTAEVFVKNPFPDGMGARMYRTGDLGYFDIHGQLVFLGRIDHQVKVRGFRIELGEIETQLRNHPAVKQCVTVIRKEAANQNQIIAYVVLNERILTGELRTYLEELLPRYMIPGHILELEELPLNRNGKIDRKALPDPDQVMQSLDPAELPKTHIEKTVAQIWEEVLEISPIGVNHNFFQLGGHSLRIIQVRSRINQLLGVDVSVIELFRRPTVGQLAQFLEEQLPGAAGPQRPAISKVPEAPYYPMSHAQQRLFFLHQIDPNNTAYNLSTTFTLRTALNPEALKKAIQTVTNRQASLRTTFTVKDNKPVQLVARDHEICAKFLDFSHIDSNRRDQLLAKHLDKEVHTAFDLTKQPPFYTIVFKLEEQHFVLFFHMHHIISDLWSWEIFFRELFTLYQNYLQGKEISLPTLNIQYTDYAVWQNQCIENGDFQGHADYWQKQLAGELPAAEFPLDYPRALAQKYRAGFVNRDTPGTCLKQLRRLFQQKNVTTFIGLLAVFYAFFSRITGQEDIIIGTVEGGRGQSEVQKLIGFFVNTLPLRVNLEGDPGFLELIDRVKQVSLDAYEHAEYPFDLIIEQLNLDRDLSRNPLFSVLFSVNEEMGEIGPGSDSKFSASEYSIKARSIHFDFRVLFIERRESLHCSFGYCKDLFKDETVQRWMQHFMVLFEAVIAAPEQKISSIPLFTEGQKKQILVDWNRTNVEYPKNKTIHQLFEDQVRRTPDYTALVGKEEGGKGRRVEASLRAKSHELSAVTYKELNQKSSQLARWLSEKGAAPRTIVSIMVEPSIEMIVGIMAVLKSGAAFLPIDPDFPDERITYMLKDSNAQVLVVGDTSRASGLSFAPKALLNLSAGHHLDFPSSHLPIFPSSLFPSLAYIIYTSGTTGKPKGVLIDNRNLVNYVSWFTKMVGLTAQDNTMLTSSFAFDLIYTSLFSSLLTGGELHLIPGEDFLSGEKLLRYIRKNRVTYIKVTPALFTIMVNSPVLSPRMLQTLRVIVLGGEQIMVKDVGKVHDLCPGISIINHYGPTETTIGSVARFIDFDQFEEYKRAPTIGKPIHNTRVYVLDKNLQPVPIGTAGELVIGGDGAARGYLNQPELTAEKFPCGLYRSYIPQRIYKTGDLARWHPDGNIEILGRIDHQVKIRGYRVELSEIENQLLKNHLIKEAVVLIQKDNHQEKYLCAYIVVNSAEGTGITPNSSELREYLSKHLPHYMIPTQFIQVEKIPLAQSRKVDRKALTAMGKKIDTAAQYQPPQNIIEKIMAEQWQDVLEIERVSVTDNFFHLGGHSLKAVKLIAKLKNSGIGVSINQLFRYQSIKELSQYIFDTDTGDAYLIKDVKEAEEIFEKEFNSNGEFITYHIGEKIYHVFYIENELQKKYQDIARFFRDHLSKEICPHFIRGVSQKPAANEKDYHLSSEDFSKMMQFKNESPDLWEPTEQVRQVCARVKQELNKFNETIVANQTVKQYQLSSMQRGHLTLENRARSIRVSFDKYLDHQLLEEALLELIQNQGILRSTLVEKNGELSWNEFQPPQRITIPGVDLIDYPPGCKEQLISQILKQMETGYSCENPVLYRPVLFKKDLRNHLLVITLDHSIYDGMSREIITRNLVDSLRLKEKKQNIRQPVPPPYSDYIQQILKGPQDIDQDELIKMFELKEFSESLRKFETISREKQTDNINRLYYELAFPEGITAENVWEVSFFVFNLFLKRYLGLSEIPVRIVSYGRRYGQKDFFDTVGEFIDLIPVLVHMDEESPTGMFTGAGKKLENASTYNINFMSLMYEQSLKEKWKRAKDFITPGPLVPDDTMILFNFVGKAAEERVNQLKQSYRGTAGKEKKICTFSSEIYYTSNSLYFFISTSLAVDADTFARMKISGEELKRMIKR